MGREAEARGERKREEIKTFFSGEGETGKQRRDESRTVKLCSRRRLRPMTTRSPW